MGFVPRVTVLVVHKNVCFRESLGRSRAEHGSRSAPLCTPCGAQNFAASAAIFFLSNSQHTFVEGTKDSNKVFLRAQVSSLKSTFTAQPRRSKHNKLPEAGVSIVGTSN